MKTKEDAAAAGALCDLCPYKSAPYVPPAGPDAADIEFRGERPGGEEARTGIPLTGPTGKLYDYLMSGAGLDRAAVKTDNAVACFPGKEPDDKELAQALACCRPRLKAPKRLVAMGSMALASAGHGVAVSEVAGIPLKGHETSVFPVYHPAVALPHREPGMLRVSRIYWDRVARWHAADGVFPLWELPPVVTNLTHDDATCLATIAELKRRAYYSKPIGLDVENPMIGKKAIEWETKGRVLFDVGIADGDRDDPLAFCASWQIASAELKAAVLDFVTTPHALFAMHNGKHDCRVFWLAEGTLVPGYKLDTMEMFRLRFPGISKGLDMVASMLTEFPRHKDEFRADRDASRPDSDRFADADPLKRAVYCGHDSFVQSYIARVLLALGGF